MSQGGARGWIIFGLCSLGFILSMFYRVSPSILAVQLTGELNLTSSELGDISAAFFYAFAFCQIPLGLVLDRKGIRWPMTLLMLLGVAGAVVFGLAPNKEWALAGRVLLGVGASCNLMGALALIARWFPATVFATLSGLLVALGSLGQMLGATPLALMTEALGWRGSFMAVAAFHLALTAVFALLARDDPPGAPARPRHAGNPLAGLGRVLARPSYWGISLATFFRYGCTVTIQALWGGPLLIYGLGLSVVEAGNALVALSFGMMLGLPLGGRLSDRWLGTRKWVIMPSLAGLTLAMAAMLLLRPGESLALVYAVFFVVGLASAPGQIMYAHIKELSPPELTATGLTGINLFTMLGSAVVMQITGFLVVAEPSAASGPGAFAPALIFMSIGLGVASLVYLLVPDTRP